MLNFYYDSGLSASTRHRVIISMKSARSARLERGEGKSLQRHLNIRQPRIGNDGIAVVGQILKGVTVVPRLSLPDWTRNRAISLRGKLAGRVQTPAVLLSREGERSGGSGRIGGIINYLGVGEPRILSGHWMRSKGSIADSRDSRRDATLRDARLVFHHGLPRDFAPCRDVKCITRHALVTCRAHSRL